MRPLSARKGLSRPLAAVAALAALVVLATLTANTAGAARGGGHDKVVLVPPGLSSSASSPENLQSPPTNLTKAARPSATEPADAVDPVDLKLLVISADGNETDFPYLKATLDRIGIPYDVLVATETTLTPDLLYDGALHGYYQGIVLTTGNLTHFDGAQWTSAFTDAEWQTLYAYERQFGVRQVTSYTYPSGLPEGSATGAYGLRSDTDPASHYDPSVPLQTTLTAAGQAVFPYLNAATPITFRNAWVYMATGDTCDATTDCASLTPLLTTADGHVVATVKRYLDGRENLATTAANAEYLIHSSLLSYGVVNWVTRGLFLGERHVNLDVQVDDLLADDNVWDAAADSDQTGLTYRLTGVDFKSLRAWQTSARANPLFSRLTLEHAFNGAGATGIYQPDTLTRAVKSGQRSFNWVNHGWEHLNLDAIDVAAATAEIQQNNAMAVELGLSSYSPDSYVQADISGLGNAAFLQAAAQLGVKYLVSGPISTPNVGVYSSFQPGILVIPRRATTLYYNVTTPAEWTDEYNHFYAPGGLWPYWDHALTYDELLDVVSDSLLAYLLSGDLDPWMFHQANLRDYGGGHSLLSDLLDRTFEKYTRYYTLPVRNLTEHDVGLLMAQRMAYEASDVTASMTPCTRGQTQVTLVSSVDVTVPVTGVAVKRSSETYGGQSIAQIALSGGVPVTVKASCS